jgi:very-short-patch-repair endonuclease
VAHGQRSSRRSWADERNVDDLAIERLVRRGVVLREDLMEAGVGVGAIDFRVRERRLRPFMGPGAYLVGHEDAPPLAREHAALLVAGDGAVIFDDSAALLWRMPGVKDDGPVHVALGEKRRSTATIQYHRASLDRWEWRTMHGDIRLTSPARTIADIAGGLELGDLEHVVADAIRRRIVTERELGAYATGRRGAVKLRTVLQLEGGPAWTRSRAEREMLKLIRGAGLPAPRVNRRDGGKERDLIFDAERLIVEIDGFSSHGDRVAFEADRARDSERAARGWMTLRFTWRRVRDQGHGVVAELAASLALR